MIRKSDDLVGSQLHDVAHQLRLRIDARLRPWRLTRQKWLALGLMRDRPDMTQAELAARLELGPAATGRLVDRMEARGFVQRRESTQDRRAYRLRVTADAERVLERLHEEADAIRAEVQDGLTDAEIETVGRALQRMKANLAALSASAVAVAAPVLPWAIGLAAAGGPGLS